MNEMKAQYSKYNYCQYMYVSAQNLLHAISLFSSSREGDVERSFSAFHKAWVLLFQADILIGPNGFLHQCNCEGKFSCGEKSCIKSKSKIKYVYGIESALTEIQKYKTDHTVLTILENCYSFSNGTGLFKELNQKGNFFKNLLIVKELRNIDQHDYMESRPNESVRFMEIVKPYIIANLRNFITTYSEMEKRFLIEGKYHPSNRDCSCNKLLSVQELSGRCFLPWSYDAIFDSVKSATDNEENYQTTIAVIEHQIAFNRQELEAEISRLEGFDKSLKSVKVLTPQNPLISKIENKKTDIKNKEKEIESLSRSLKRARYLLDLYYKTRPNESSTVRSEFFNAIKAHEKIPHPDLIEHLKIAISASTSIANINPKADKELNIDKAALNAEMINNYLALFVHDGLHAVTEKLKIDKELKHIKIHRNTLKPIAEEIYFLKDHSMYGEFFNRKKFTDKFFLYAKQRLIEKYPKSE